MSFVIITLSSRRVNLVGQSELTGNLALPHTNLRNKLLSSCENERRVSQKNSTLKKQKEQRVRTKLPLIVLNFF